MISLDGRAGNDFSCQGCDGNDSRGVVKGHHFVEEEHILSCLEAVHFFWVSLLRQGSGNGGMK